jgi:hypothetical protein
LLRAALQENTPVLGRSGSASEAQQAQAVYAQAPRRKINGQLKITVPVPVYRLGRLSKAQ